MPAEHSTPVGDSDDKSLPSEDGVKVSPPSLDTAFTPKSVASSSTGSEIDASGVWSLDTMNSEVVVSKKTPITLAQSRI